MEEISSMNNDMAIMTGLAIDSSHQQDINVSHTAKNFFVENLNEKSGMNEVTDSTEVNSQEDTLDSVKNAVIELFQRVDYMQVNNKKNVVLLLIEAGKMLNTIEKKLRNKTAYRQWIRSFVTTEHNIRKMQHAKQLARMGEVSVRYAGMGKNRLLEINRVQKETEIPFEVLIQKMDLDTTIDNDERSFNMCIDALITQHRFEKKDMNFVTFEDAKKIVIKNRKVLNVNQTEEVRKLLDPFQNKKEKFKEILENDIDQITGIKNPATQIGPENNDLVLSKFLIYLKEIDIDNKEIRKEIKSSQTYGIILQIKDYLTEFVRKVDTREEAKTS
ncbi:MAG: hypothetical protein ACMUIP_08470 [bacterium]